MNNREKLIYLHTIKGVGWRTINKLMDSPDGLDNLFTSQPLEMSMKTGIELRIAEKIKSQLTDNNISYFLTKYSEWKSKYRIITFLDQDYPELLKQIAQPPWVIFLSGNLELLNKPTIAIVGTRNPTSYGTIVADRLAKELVEYDFAIVSGMARGIDRIAHEAALKNNGSAIAVLGSGVDVIYPRENAKLYNLLLEKGLILSEFPPGTEPHPSYFPQRNRIISGLSLGTIIVEASMKSGSLITAQYAVDQSREVFAVPGPIYSTQSLGCNSLIQQGAKLIQNIEDVLIEFQYLVLNKKNGNDNIELSDEEKLIYGAINYEPVNINDILNEVNLNISDIYEAIFSLQLKKLIKQLPGGLYIRL